MCCDQVTKTLCSKYGITSASSARSPCNHGPLAYFADFGPSGSECKCCACPIPLFSAVLDVIHEKSLRVGPLMTEPLRPRDSL